MSERYTSADLGRRLRDAGLDQECAEAVWYRSAVRGGQMVLVLGNNGGPEQVRALRLDEVLEELTREREGGPLAPGVLIEGAIDETGMDEPAWDCRTLYRTASALLPVEAAGLVLAQLLEARR